MSVINAASSSHTLVTAAFPLLLSPPPAHAALHGVPVECPVSVHYFISGGIDCRVSLKRIHIQYKHNWSPAAPQRHAHTFKADHRQCWWNMNRVWEEEQNAPLIRMWHAAVFPWSHYQPSFQGSLWNIILSHRVCAESRWLQCDRLN